MKMENGNEVLVQCRVDNATYVRLQAIVKKYKFKSVYEVMRFLVSSFIRAVNVKTGLEDGEDERAKEFIEMFEGFEKASSRLIRAKADGDRVPEVRQAVIVYRQSNKSVAKVKTYEKDGEGLSVTTAKERSLEVVMEQIYPRLSGVLYDIGDIMGETRLSRVISELATTFISERKGVDKEFNGLDGSTEYGSVPVRKKNSERIWQGTKGTTD